MEAVRPLLLTMLLLQSFIDQIRGGEPQAMALLVGSALGLVTIFLVVQTTRRRRLLGAPSALTQEVRRTLALPALSGRISAQDAYRAAGTALAPFDPEFRMTLISTGDYIGEEGKSACWEMYFDLPKCAARAVCTVQPLDLKAPADGQPLSLDVVLRPAPSLWKAEDPSGYLPNEFRDSPDAVQSLIQQGKDFLDTDTRHILAAKILPSGDAVWSTTAYDTEYRTDFST